MSCTPCDEQQDDPTTGIAFYRWKNANIAIDGCKEHLLEIFDALNKAQELLRDDTIRRCQGCERTVPNHLINALIASGDDGDVKETLLCAVCALKERNEVVGLKEGTPFTGTLAKQFYKETVEYYKKTNQ